MTLEPQIKHIQEERGGSFVVVVTDDHLFIEGVIIWKMSIERMNTAAMPNVSCGVVIST